MSWPFSYRVDPETQLEFACTCLLFVLFQCQSITDHYLVKTILSVVLVQQLCCANMSLLCKTCPWNLLVPAALCKHYDFVCVAPSGVCKHCANILCRFCALCMICPSANISIAWYPDSIYHNIPDNICIHFSCVLSKSLLHIWPDKFCVQFGQVSDNVWIMFFDGQCLHTCRISFGQHLDTTFWPDKFCINFG